MGIGERLVDLAPAIGEERQRARAGDLGVELAGQTSAQLGQRSARMVALGQLIERLVEASSRSNSGIAVAHDGRYLQSAHLLLPVSLKTELDSWIVSGRRSIRDWLRTHEIGLADFSDNPDAFANINTPDDLDDA